MRVVVALLVAQAVLAGCGGANEIEEAIDAAFAHLTTTTSGSGSGTITVSPSSAAGGVPMCGPSCQKYPKGTVVTLTATPAAESTFAGWSGGGCSGTGNCTITLNADAFVVATFNR